VDGYVLEGSPLEVIRGGRHSAVPLVIGTNADEATALLPGPVPSEAAYRAATLGLLGPTTGAAVLDRYPAAAHDGPTGAMAAAITDARFTCPTRDLARAAAAHGPVYRYFFTHALESGPARRLGAFHGLELGFVFGNLGAAGGYAPSAAERALSNALIGYWSRFAATGDPNGGGAPAWPRYEAASDPYLRLDTAIQADAGLRTANCDFWDTVPPVLAR
jgi:para-nitrobenzyl esterase